MQRFISRESSFPIRMIFAVLGFIGTLMVTGKLLLSREMFSRFLYDKDFHLAIHRSAWYALMGWTKVEFIPINTQFDFTAKLSTMQLKAVRSFLETRKDTIDRDVYLAARLFISARVFSNTRLHHDLIDYATNVNALLEELDTFDVPEVQSKETKIPHEEAAIALTDFSRMLPLQQWEWFVMSGTFLGLIREGGFLPHDYDIDIGIMKDGLDEGKLLREIRSSKTFSLCKVDVFYPYDKASPALLSLIKIRHNNGMPIDIFVHHKEDSCSGERIWHGSSLHKWINTPFGLASYEMAGTEVLGPDNADKYLTENYGEWRIPVTQFNCSTGTPNLKIVHDPSAVAAFLKKAQSTPGERQKIIAKLEEDEYLYFSACSGSYQFNIQAWQ